MKEQIQKYAQSNTSDESNTYLPYYDIIIEKDKKGFLSEVKNNELTRAWIQQNSAM